MVPRWPRHGSAWSKNVQDICLEAVLGFRLWLSQALPGFASVLPSLCLRVAFALPSLCLCFAFALFLYCLCFAFSFCFPLKWGAPLSYKPNLVHNKAAGKAVAFPYLDISSMRPPQGPDLGPNGQIRQKLATEPLLRIPYRPLTEPP